MNKDNPLYCSRCHSVNKPLFKYSKILYKGKTYQYYMCNECGRKKMKKYYRTKNGKVAIKNAVSKYVRNNREKSRVWDKARKLKLLGKQCEICGRKFKIIKHHPNYSKPLEVIYLCHFHHNWIHRLLKLL